MTDYAPLATAIIKHQESIIGPLAWNEADKVSGLSVENKNVLLSGDGKKILESLVRQYENLFGQASVEACKDAVRPLIAKEKTLEVPQILL